MKQLLQLGRVIGSVAALSEATWAAFEFVRLENGQSVLIEDAFDFFRKHPEHLSGVHLALAVAGITVLFILNASWVARFYLMLRARMPKNRFRAMAITLEIELDASEIAIFNDQPLFDPERIVERRTIQMKLSELGICTPVPNEAHRNHVIFLTIIIPYARNGDVKGARLAAEECIAALP